MVNDFDEGTGIVHVSVSHDRVDWSGSCKSQVVSLVKVDTGQ